MKYIVKKEISINEDYPSIGGTWYYVVPETLLLRLLSFILIPKPFRDLKEAKRCAKLKSILIWIIYYMLCAEKLEKVRDIGFFECSVCGDTNAVKPCKKCGSELMISHY